MTLTEQMTRLARQAKEASRPLGQLTTSEKNGCLLAMADAIEARGFRVLSAGPILGNDAG